MSLVVTGATGQFGRHVVESLLARGVAADQIVAGGRSLDRIADLGERGVRVARIDYDDPASLQAAFQGADRVLLVSGSQVGQRVPQHRAATQAAAAAGVRFLAYTSAPSADRTTLQLADEHRQTEAAIRESGVPFAFLRNGWYFENYTAQIPTYLQTGVVLGSAGDGRISGAARADQAEAAAVVLSTDGHEGAIYELGGDEAFTLSQLAAEVARASGRAVVYRDLSVADYTAALEQAGLPAPMAAIFADTDRSIREGELFIDTGDLHRLLGRATTTLSQAVAAAVQAAAVR